MVLSNPLRSRQGGVVVDEVVYLEGGGGPVRAARVEGVERHGPTHTLIRVN